MSTLTDLLWSVAKWFPHKWKPLEYIISALSAVGISWTCRHCNETAWLHKFLRENGWTFWSSVQNAYCISRSVRPHFSRDRKHLKQTKFSRAEASTSPLKKQEVHFFPHIKRVLLRWLSATRLCLPYRMREDNYNTINSADRREGTGSRDQPHKIAITTVRTERLLTNYPVQ